MHLLECVGVAVFDRDALRLFALPSPLGALGAGLAYGERDRTSRERDIDEARARDLYSLHALAERVFDQGRERVCERAWILAERFGGDQGCVGCVVAKGELGSLD